MAKVRTVSGKPLLVRGKVALTDECCTDCFGGVGGACCDRFTCFIEPDEATCLARGFGVYYAGDGTTCDDVDCTIVGCCVDGADCQTILGSDCFTTPFIPGGFCWGPLGFESQNCCTNDPPEMGCISNEGSGFQYYCCNENWGICCDNFCCDSRTQTCCTYIDPESGFEFGYCCDTATQDCCDAAGCCPIGFCVAGICLA